MMIYYNFYHMVHLFFSLLTGMACGPDKHAPGGYSEQHRWLDNFLGQNHSNSAGMLHCPPSTTCQPHSSSLCSTTNCYSCLCILHHPLCFLCLWGKCDAGYFHIWLHFEITCSHHIKSQWKESDILWLFEFIRVQKWNGLSISLLYLICDILLFLLCLYFIWSQI